MKILLATMAFLLLVITNISTAEAFIHQSKIKHTGEWSVPPSLTLYDNSQSNSYFVVYVNAMVEKNGVKVPADRILLSCNGYELLVEAGTFKMCKLAGYHRYLIIDILPEDFHNGSAGRYEFREKLVDFLNL